MKQFESGNRPMNEQERKLCALSEKVWREEVVEKVIEKQPLAMKQPQQVKKAKKGKKKETTLDDVMECKRRYD